MTKIRVYDLARKLKQDTKRIIEELRREGVDVSVPSDAISVDIAERIKNKYFSKTEPSPKRSVEVLKNCGLSERKKEIKFKCENCGLITEKDAFKCLYCGFVLVEGKNDKRVVRKKRLTEGRCSFCNVVAKNLKKHKQICLYNEKKGSKTEHCNYCGKETFALKKHQENCDRNPRFIRFKKQEVEPKFEKIKIEHTPLPPEKKRKGRCRVCKKNFPMAQSNICYSCGDK